MEAASEAAEALWSGAVAALAAPPNSYSAVTDPIDLVCSRGGDLGMLEVLKISVVQNQKKFVETSLLMVSTDNSYFNLKFNKYLYTLTLLNRGYFRYLRIQKSISKVKTVL